MIQAHIIIRASNNVISLSNSSVPQFSLFHRSTHFTDHLLHGEQIKINKETNSTQTIKQGTWDTGDSGTDPLNKLHTDVMTSFQQLRSYDLMAQYESIIIIIMREKNGFKQWEQNKHRINYESVLFQPWSGRLLPVLEASVVPLTDCIRMRFSLNRDSVCEIVHLRWGLSDFPHQVIMLNSTHDKRWGAQQETPRQNMS